LRLNDLRRSELIRHSCAGPSRTAESSTPDVVRPVVHRRHTRAQCFGEAEQDAAVAVTGVNSRPRRKLTGKYPTIFPCSCCSLLTVGTPRRSGRRHRYAPMPLFWLCYRHNNQISVVIEPAPSLIHARMRASLDGLDQGDFPEGHELDRKREK